MSQRRKIIQLEDRSSASPSPIPTPPAVGEGLPAVGEGLPAVGEALPAADAMRAPVSPHPPAEKNNALSGLIGRGSEFARWLIEDWS